MARSSIFEDAEIDLSSFAPRTETDAPPVEKVRTVAEAARFPSREASPPKLHREPRTYRTGRNVQFNVKASREAIETFYKISDEHGWVLGETLEHALKALAEKLGR
jgi:hypothetical protein